MMKKKTTAWIASLLALGLCVNICAPHIEKAVASETAGNQIVSVADGTKFGKETASMSGYKASDVAQVIEKVYNYANGKFNGWDWLTATYHLGNLEAYKATGNSKYYQTTYETAQKYDWKVNGGNDTTYLDAVATSLVYCVLHSLAPKDYKLEGVKDILDYNYEFSMVDYSWVDEIYMAGLSHSYLSKVTGDSKYSEIDFDTYMYYRDRFFDEESWLWYRDGQFVLGTGSSWANQDGAEKVLWSRGNAWVYVTLAQRMEHMDKTDPAYETYKNDFLMMSEGLKKVQREDGVWNVNLGDPTHKPGKEMTGTGGFLYGLCLGIELGLLDSDVYLPVVQKAYDTIVGECIQESGLVGYCQPPAGSPSSYTTEEKLKDNTVSYGVGLTLMGLSHFMRLCDDYEEPTLNTPAEEYDSTKASYAVLDTDWYKGVMIASTNATAYTTANNGVENMINGSWKSAEEGESFRGNGLKKGITVYVDIPADGVDLNKIVMVLQASYAYNYTIEIYDGTSWTTVADTTAQTANDKAYILEHTFTTVENCKQIKLTANAYHHNSNIDTLWIREMLVYEAK